jgi:thioredoxin-like negative regulator of GroEL
MNKKNCENGKEKKILELLSTSKPLLLEIRAECCDDSYLTERIIQKIESEFNNDIRIARLDYKTYKNVFPHAEVKSFPMVALIKDGTVSKVIYGNMSRTNLKALANDLLETNKQTAKEIITKK